MYTRIVFLLYGYFSIRLLMGIIKGKKKKKKIFTADVLAVKVFEKDLIEETRKKLVLDRAKNDLSSKDYIMSYANTGAAQLKELYLGGKYRFSDDLPTSYIGALGVPSDVIKSIIYGLEGTEKLTFFSTTYDAPEGYDWVIFQLQETIGYKVKEDIVHIDEQYFSFDSYEYNEESDKFEATLKSLINLVEVKGRNIHTLIDSYSEDKDKKTLIIEDITQLYQLDDEENMIKLYESIKTISEDTEIIDKDTEDSYTEYIEISEEFLSNENNTIIEYLPAYEDEVGYYSAGYYNNETDENKLWFYNPETKEYPQLESNNYSEVSLDTYPVVMFRNDNFNLDDYNINSKWIQSGNKAQHIYRPSSITKKRYDETSAVFNSIGIDLDELTKNIEENPDVDKLCDSFLMVGVIPTDTNPIVSKALYETFNFLYNKLPPKNLGSGNIYRYDVLEGPFNTRLTWTPIPIETKKEIIGKKDTYTHEVKDVTHRIYQPYPYKYSKITRDGETQHYIVTTTCSYDYEKRRLNCRTFHHRINVRPNGTMWIRWQNEGERRTYSNTDGTESSYAPYRELEVKIIGGNSAQIISYADITLESISCKHQITEDTTKTIVISVPSEYNIFKPYIRFTGLFRTKKSKPESSLWSTFIDRGGRGATVSIGFRNKNFVIPIPVGAAEKMTFIEQTSLLSSSLHLAFYAARYDEIKYYSGGLFGKILGVIAIAIAIVINIVSLGSSTPLTGAVVAGSAAATAAATAAVAALVKTLLIGMALSIVLKIISSTVHDTTLQMVLSIAATVTAMYIGGSFDNFSFDLKFAGDLLDFSTQAVDIITGSIYEAKNAQIKLGMNKLNKEMNQFQSSYESAMSKLSSAYDDLMSGLDPFDIVDLNIGRKQTVDSFIFSPSVQRFMMIDAYKNYDFLYENGISQFVTEKLRVGNIDI